MSKYSMTRYVASNGYLREHPLVLIDVGASGGIQTHWNAFGEALVAFAFEPLLDECERLNRTKRSDKIQYFPFFLSDGSNQPSSLKILASRSTERDTTLGRSSAIRAEELIGRSAIETYNLNRTPSFGSIVLKLDDFIENNSVPDVDFIKIDTDGSDYEVLLGAEKTLKKFDILGVAVEALLGDPPSAIEQPELFCPMHEFLRSHGFQLYDLIPHRYSRRDLPAPFYYDFPAQTITGQVAWADCIYFKDACANDPAHPVEYPDPKLLKLACLYEIHGFPDCAAELILHFRDRFDRIVNGTSELLLDALTPDLAQRQLTFQQYNVQFENNMEIFFNAGVDISTMTGEVAFLRKQLNNVMNSKSWKLTKPLRWLHHKWNGLDFQR
jgi:FkbM family methyltransferase